MSNLDKANRIAELLKEANKAMMVHKDEPDNGSCNLDTVLIDFEGKRKTFVDQVSSLSGYSLSKITSGYHKGLYMLFLDYHGQANVRYQMVQTAKDYLNDNGVKASVWYQLD